MVGGAALALPGGDRNGDRNDRVWLLNVHECEGEGAERAGAAKACARSTVALSLQHLATGTLLRVDGGEDFVLVPYSTGHALQTKLGQVPQAPLVNRALACSLMSVKN